MKDIRIGKNKWIKWVDFDSTRDHSLFDIDPLLKPTFGFWNQLETQCVAECCGIEAYTFEEDDIRLAAEKIDKAELIPNLVDVKAKIEGITEHTLISEKLNQLIHKSVFIQLLNHIITTIPSEEK